MSKTISSVLTLALLYVLGGITAYASPDEVSSEVVAPKPMEINYEKLHSLQAHWGNVNDVTFSPNGQYAATTSDDSSMIVWNVSSGEQRFKVKYKRLSDVIKSEHNVMAASFSPDSQSIFSGSYQNERFGEMKWHSVKTGKKKWSNALSPGIMDMDYSPDGKNISIAYLMGRFSAENRNIKNVMKGKKNKFVKLEGHKDMVSSIDYSPDGKQIATTSLDGNMVVWSAKTGQRKYAVKSVRLPQRASFSADGQYLAVSWGTKLKILNSQNGDEVLELYDGSLLKEELEKYELILDVKFHPNGKVLAAGSSNGGVYFFDTMTGALISQITKAHSEAVRTLDYSHDGSLLMTGSDDDKAIIWKAVTP